MKYSEHQIIIDLKEHEKLIEENKKLKSLFNGKNLTSINKIFQYHAMGYTCYEYNIYTESELAIALTETINSMSKALSEKSDEIYKLKTEALAIKNKSFW